MAIIMVASTVALLLVSAGFVAYELITYPKTMLRDLTTLADVLGGHCEAALRFENQEAAGGTLAALEKNGHIAAAALYDENGKLFAQYRNGLTPLGLIPEAAEPVGSRFEDDHLILFHPVRLDGDTVGTLFLKSDLKEKHARFQQYANIIVLITLASLIVTYFLSSLLQRVISRPISHLAETARDVSQRKNYAVRATKSGDDELGQLIDGFNEMLGQIQQRDAALLGSNEELERRVEARTQALRGEISERQRAEASLQQQFARLSLLNQITHAISDRQDTDSILHVVLSQLKDHMGLELPARLQVGSPERQCAGAGGNRLSALRARPDRLSARHAQSRDPAHGQTRRHRLALRRSRAADG
jgi:HAMP domain-containing protein